MTGLIRMALLAAALAACAAGPAVPPGQRGPATSGATHTVFVTSNGWHSAIVVARADLPPGSVPEAADFPGARFLEFGWGDAEYYPAKDPTLGMALGAALTPTPAVVHLAGLDVAPALRYPQAEVVALALDTGAVGRLARFIGASFERGGRARVAATGPGLYATSRFYPAVGRFHLFNTCNTWTARALAAAGLAVTESGTATAEGLMDQVRRLGTRR